MTQEAKNVGDSYFFITKKRDIVNPRQYLYQNIFKRFIWKMKSKI